MRGEGRPRLRPAEWRVLARLARGESDREIAAVLGLAPGTVRGYVTKIYQLLPRSGGGKKRAAAARWYREHAEGRPEEADRG